MRAVYRHAADVQCVQCSVVLRRLKNKAPVEKERTRSRSPLMRYDKKRMYARHQLSKMNIGGEHIVAATGRLHQIAER